MFDERFSFWRVRGAAVAVDSLEPVVDVVAADGFVQEIGSEHRKKGLRVAGFCDPREGLLSANCERDVSELRLVVSMEFDVDLVPVFVADGDTEEVLVEAPDGPAIVGPIVVGRDRISAKGAHDGVYRIDNDIMIRNESTVPVPNDVSQVVKPSN